MDSGYYAAMTGLLARTQALDTAAANLANAQTPGYRAEREYFRSVLLGPDRADSQLGEAVNRFGLLGGDRLSLAQGPLERTGNPLDLSIEGEGFFAIQTANGLRFTRDGSFHRSQAGALVIGVFRFPAGAQLRAEGANRYAAEEAASLAQPGSAIVHQGSVEGANEDVVQGTLDLMMMQRQAEMMQKALTVFHTEFNKTACEDLPKV